MFNYLEKHKTWLVYLPLLVYWLILLAATSFPTDNMPEFGVSDKIKHTAAYFLLAVLLNITLIFQNRFILLKRYAFIATGIIAIFYGLIDELHQILIPGRSCEFLDWVADVIGVLAGIILVKLLIKWQNFSIE